MAKQFKVVAASSEKSGTKHRVQLEIHRLKARRIVEKIAEAVVDGKRVPAHEVTSYPLLFYPVYIKNVLLASVTGTTLQTAARALIVEYKDQELEPKQSTGFASYEEEFDRA